MYYITLYNICCTLIIYVQFAKIVQQCRQMHRKPENTSVNIAGMSRLIPKKLKTKVKNKSRNIFKIQHKHSDM